MLKENQIMFIINDYTKLQKIAYPKQLVSLQGYVDIIIDNENIMRKDDVKLINDSRIFGVALTFQKKLEELIKSDETKIEIDCGDYWNIIFYKKDDKVSFSLLRISDNIYVFEDKKIAFKDFLRHIFSASIMFSIELHKNLIISNMKEMRLLDMTMIENSSLCIEKGIFTESEIEIIFEKFLTRKRPIAQLDFLHQTENSGE